MEVRLVNIAKGKKQSNKKKSITVFKYESKSKYLDNAHENRSLTRDSKYTVTFMK